MGDFLWILMLSAVAEAIIEYFVQPALKPQTAAPTMEEPEPAGVDWRGMSLRWASAIVGVVLCVAYRVDLLAILGLASPVPVVGCVLTGVLIGRGSNWLNDFSDRWLRPVRR